MSHAAASYRESSPYPGLRPFEAHEAHLFFGREDQVEDMLVRLEDRSFLAVVGTSGCGKSSLVRAGLIPAVKDGWLSGAPAGWKLAVMRPGDRPFTNLAERLLTEGALPSGLDPELALGFLEATLRRGPLGLRDAVDRAELPAGEGLLVVVDQFEEIFRFRELEGRAAEAEAFVHLLLGSAGVKASGAALAARSDNAALDDGDDPGSEAPICIVITMRSDFIGDCSQFPELPDALNDSQFLASQLTREEIRQAIVRPAEDHGGRVEPGLVNQLLNDLESARDGFPVLQHVLMWMWRRAGEDDGEVTLTIADYEKAGEVDGALSQHCDAVLEELERDGVDAHVLRTMFRALSDVRSGARGTRRPTKISTIAEMAQLGPDRIAPVLAAAEAFRREGRSFIVASGPAEMTADTMLDISHEALIRRWDWLDKKAAEEAEWAATFARLAGSERRHATADAELLAGTDLVVAERWWKTSRPTPAWAVHIGASEGDYRRTEAFVTRSRRESNRARLRSRCVSGVIAALIVGLAIWGQIKARKADAQAIEADAQANEAKGKAEEAKQRLARYFATESSKVRKEAPVEGLLLAVEAVSSAPIAVARHALAEAVLTVSGEPLLTVSGEPLVRGLSLRTIAVNAEEAKLAAVGNDGPIRVWNLDALGDPPLELGRHDDQVEVLTFFPDGKTLASGSKSGDVRLWKLEEPGAFPRLVKHSESSITAIALGPHGKALAVANAEPEVILWEVNGRSVIRRWGIKNLTPVVALAFSHDGAELVVGAADGIARIWRLEQRGAGTGFRLPSPEEGPAVLGGHDGPVMAIVYRADNQVLATRDRTGIRTWSRPGSGAVTWNQSQFWKWPALLATRPAIPPTAFTFLGGGPRVAYGNGNRVLLWDPETPDSEPRVLLAHEGPITGLLEFRDQDQHQDMLISSSEDGVLRKWSLQPSRADPRVLKSEGSISSLATSRGAGLLVTAEEGGKVGGKVRVRNLGRPADAAKDLKGPVKGILSVAIGATENQEYVAAAGKSSKIWLWEVTESKPTDPIEFDGHKLGVNEVAFSQDGEWLASASDDGTIQLWRPSEVMAQGSDAKSSCVLNCPRRNRTTSESVSFSPNTLLAAGHGDGTVTVWDISRCERKDGVKPDATTGSDEMVDFSPCKGEDRVEPELLHGHGDTVKALSFSPDGRALATAGADETVMLWNITPSDTQRPVDPEEPRVLRGHDSEVLSLAFAPDGETLATGEMNGVYLWELGDRLTEPRLLRGHSGAVNGLAFSADGEVLVSSGSDDRTVRLWRPGDMLFRRDVETLKGQGCRRAGRNLTLKEWRRYLGDERYSRVCPKLPVDLSAIVEADRLIRLGHFERAFSDVSAILQSDVVEGEVVKAVTGRMLAPKLLERIETAATDGRLSEAVKTLEMALDWDPRLAVTPKVLWALCGPATLSSKEDLKDKFAACGMSIDREPKVPSHRAYRGILHSAAGHLTEAAEDFTQFLDLSKAAKNDLSPFTYNQITGLIKTFESGRNLVGDSTISRFSELEYDPITGWDEPNPVGDSTVSR